MSTPIDFYKFEGDEEFLLKMIQKEIYSKKEREHAEQEFYNHVENNLFNILNLITKNMNISELGKLDSRDLLKLIEKYINEDHRNEEN
ncbi:hypothetical protein C9374_003127 [Naegleria lovaniensis]|uniref:Uncharacterized protein n=1 Tax=Naegleria lovaniensis TaxID=51637 RepID=A0AA88GTZ2_NAELO|nr:uncharacterized protein C9374_003127 [Naegleria lovaniensis]KAG2385978.1 hypothetical protein C9374_003127 [Naegleria lovaniensis]